MYLPNHCVQESSRRKNGGNERVEVFRNSVMQIWIDGSRNKRVSCERLWCHRITCKSDERKKCVHGSKERLKEQYSLIP